MAKAYGAEAVSKNVRRSRRTAGTFLCSSSPSAGPSPEVDGFLELLIPDQFDAGEFAGERRSEDLTAYPPRSDFTADRSTHHTAFAGVADCHGGVQQRGSRASRTG